MDQANIESFKRYSQEYLSQHLEDRSMTYSQALINEGRGKTMKEMQPLIFLAEEKARKTKYEIALSLLEKGVQIQMISEVAQLPLEQPKFLQLELAL